MRILVTAIVTILVFAAVGYTACNTVKCKDMVCGNGGTCKDGVCTCPDGFTGRLCESRVPAGNCAGIVCYNGGTCKEGTCLCASGYQGTFCDTGINVNFAGTYSVQAQCQQGGGGSYTVVVRADTANPFRVFVTNLGNYTSCTTGELAGFVLGQSLTIDDTACSRHFLVSGTLNGNTLQLTYTAVLGLDTANCTASLQRQ